MKNNESLTMLRSSLKSARLSANASARHSSKLYGTPSYAEAYARTFALRCIEVDAAIAIDNAMSQKPFQSHLGK